MLGLELDCDMVQGNEVEEIIGLDQRVVVGDLLEHSVAVNT